MRAVGESLGLGRTFPEAFLKALEGREDGNDLPEIVGLHPYFQAELESIHEAERRLADDGDVETAKRFGLPDSRIARALGITEAEVRARRPVPGRLAVDSCAAEFEARTPYYYLSYEEGDSDESAPRTLDPDPRLGPEPDRPGDRVRLLLHACRAGLPRARLRGGAAELESRDGVDRLRHLRPALPRAGHARAGARRLRARAPARRRRHARRPDAARAGPRARRRGRRSCSATPSRRSTPPRTAGKFGLVLDELGIRAPRWGVAGTREEALEVAERIGYPVLVRPHYVLGGRRMRVVRGPRRARDPRAFPRRRVPRGRDRARRRRALRRRDRLGGRDPRAHRAGRDPLG